MAATIQIHEMSASATGVDKTSNTVRFKDADNSTVDANDPLRVPDSGTNYSYTKKLRAKMTVAPDTSVDKLVWYSDGSNSFGTGVGVKIDNIGITFGTQYKTEMVGGIDLFSCTSASTLAGDTTASGPWDSGDVDTYIGDLMELQMSVADTASHGTLSAETLTLAWDEV